MVYNTPQNDLGIWYKNTRGALMTVRENLADSVKSNLSQLTSDNVLMKVREVVLDEGCVTQPEGVPLYPHRWMYLLVLLGSGLVAVISILYVMGD